MTEQTRASRLLGDVSKLFDGSRLSLARQLAGLRKNALAELIDKTPTAVAAYESGGKRPAPATVAQISLALGVDPEFFLASRSSTLKWGGPPHFRSLRSTTQLARDQAEAYGKLALDLTLTIERQVDFPALNLPEFPVDPSDDGDGPELAAQILRQHWGIEGGPVGHLIRTAENNGILIVFTPIQAASVDAYSVSPHERPLVLLNPLKDDYYRQRFDVAHELGHLVMHVDSEPGGRAIENQAHRFAAEFLLPRREVIDSLPSRPDWRALNRIKEQWGVSLQALLFRARSLGVMSEVTYRNAIATMSSRGWRRKEPGPRVALEQPSLLPQALELLEQIGMNEAAVAAECRVPSALLRVIASRTPQKPVVARDSVHASGDDAINTGLLSPSPVAIS